MQRNVFDRPVTVLVGIGVPVNVSSAREAFEVMSEWPMSRRRIGHTACMTTCCAAMNGRGDPQGARDAFLSFADDAGILAPALEDLVAANSAVTATKAAA